MQRHFSVEECATGELARLGEPSAAREHRANDFAADHRRAVDLKLEQILAGVAVRRFEKNRQSAVEQLAVFVNDCRVRRHTAAQAGFV